MPSWGMVIDLRRCIGCYSCTISCKQEHFLPPEMFWNRLVISETGHYPTVTKQIYPVGCNHCKEAVCVKVCPTRATTRREDGIVIIDADKCVGCRYCVVACPYQNRTFLSKDKDKGFFPGRLQTDFEKAGKKLYRHQVGTTEKCNFCAERIDAGLARGLQPGKDRDATPACVNTCPARALTFGDLDDPNSEVSRLIKERGGFQLHTEYNTDPSVYFIDGKIGQSNPTQQTRQESEAIGVTE
jgi:Fe-S-cluster-containing dehydrogenase component